MTSPEVEKEPRRFLLRPAGVLTQLACAVCLLLGTIAFVLVQQNKSGGAALAIAWAVGAMAGVVFGGLMSRGGLVSLLVSAALTATFGIVLVAIDFEALRSILRVLPEDDVEMIGNILVGVAVVLLATSALSLASIGQARRYARAYALAVEEAVAADPSLAQSFSAMRTVPPGAASASSPTLPPQATASSPTLPPPASAALGPPPPSSAAFPNPSTSRGVAVIRAAAPGTIVSGAHRSQPTLFPAQAPDSTSQSGPNTAPMNVVAAPPPDVSTAPFGKVGPGSLGPVSAVSDAPITAPFGKVGPGAVPDTLPSDAPPYLPRVAPFSSSPATVPGGGPHVSDAQPIAAVGDQGPTDPATPIIPAAAATNRGWKPAKMTTTQIVVRPPAEEARSRRRIYIALAGFAIGLGAGIGILVSSGSDGASGDGTTAATSPDKKPGPGPISVSGAGSGSSASVVPGAGSGATASGSGPAAAAVVVATGSGSGSAVEVTATAPTVPIRSLITAQRAALANGDAAALATTIAADAFAIGPDGDDVVEGRDAIATMLGKQLLDPPAGGFPVESKFLATGGTGNVAWTAEDLEIGVRRIAVTQVAVFDQGAWSVVALCWGMPVADATAERMAILGTLPRAAMVPARRTGPGAEDLERAVKVAFASREAFAAARSERDDGFNFGSGPGERVVGGVAIKRLFGRLRSSLKLEGDVRVGTVGADAGWAALNVVYTQKSRAATDVAQTFRVLAVLVKEDGAWKVVQTQFSNAGPIR